MTLSKDQQLRKLRQVFTPGAPVARRDLFAGRVEQVFDVTGALEQPGTHVVIYGERGVGKTSLANVLGQLLPPMLGGGFEVVRINCSTNDTFQSIWRKVFAQLRVELPNQWEYRSPDPDEVRSLLGGLAQRHIIIIDEYDRVEDDASLTSMADALKALSDHSTESKLVLVGVADSIDSLIGEHESVARAIEEVEMPRMTQVELVRIIDTGLEAADMTIDEDARRHLGRLAEGLPHYVHSLALNAALFAVSEDRSHVTTQDVEPAIRRTVERHSLIKEYQMAVQSPRRDNLFARVLTACALAEKNRLGAFTTASVRQPMSRIMGKTYDIPAFARHLNAFTEQNRGSVLRQEGSSRRYTYRFRNPLLQPFTVLTAITEQVLPPDYLTEILGDSAAN